jgi:hypothetical protein
VELICKIKYRITSRYILWVITIQLAKVVCQLHGNTLAHLDRKTSTPQWPAGKVQVGSSQVGSAQVGSSQVGSSQVGSSQVGSSQVGSAQVGSAQVGSAQVGSYTAIFSG